MKSKHLPLILLFTASSILIFGQNCLPEGIRFERQSQIDSFSIQYPGCTVIDGDVCIGDCISVEQSDITNLDGLSQLTSIKGKINIARNPLLTSIQGLQNLEVIEDDLLIGWNEKLSSLDGLNQVRVIKGSFTIEFMAGLENITGFEMLDTIMGTLTMTYLWYVTSIDPFSYLRYLGGFEINGLGSLPSIPDMNNLEYLGDFIISYSEITKVPQFPLLTQIDGHFRLNGTYAITEIVGYENIKHVNGDLVIDISSTELGRDNVAFKMNAFHNLTSVGGRFSVFVQQLDTLDGFIALDSVGGGFGVHFNGGFHNFPQHNQFKFIGGGISLVNLSFLEGLECLTGLDHINGLLLSSCSNLMSLSAINHFTEFGGGLELTHLNLTSFSDLSNLNAIDGSLRIYDCNSLTDLGGLENLDSINGHIFIFRNKNLESLEGIQHIDPQSIRSTGNSAITITDNPRLSTCNVESICEALRGLRKTYHIEDNAPGCDHISQIECVDYGLSGKVFLDINQNKSPDTNEVGIPGVPINVEPGNTIALSNAQGDYFVYADSGDVYTMRIVQNSDWILTTDSLSFTSTFEDGSPANDDHLFGLIPAFDWYDLSVDLTSNPIRCNQNVHFFLHWLNGSTRAVDGRIVLQYDPIVTYVASTLTPTTHDAVARELTWDLDSLALFAGQDSRITFKMANETYVGQTMQFAATAIIDSSGTEVQMDIAEYTPVLACAVDPNDKLVMPAGIHDENYTLKDEPLTYTIRFENVGNAEAIDITVTDTLDALFDMSSFKVINSSFPVFTTMDGHIITFSFQNIWLAAKGTGFVTYEVIPRSDIPDLSPVENFAGIVFDFNEPIVTNKTFNTLVEEFCQNVVVAIDTVICDGGHYMGITEPGLYFDTVQIGSYCDSITVISLEVVGPIIIQIDTSICEGEAFLGFDSTGVFTYDSINPETECAEIVILDLSIIPLGTGPCITGVGDVDEIGMRVYPNPVRNEIFIESPLPVESLRLLSLDGRMVVQKEFTTQGTNVSLDLKEGIVEGLYILVVKVEGKEYFKKVVVNR
ncbi:MAG TPA: T9SS type A sorting domain-containing protein [Saprospiraceae bacterium]